MFNGGILKTCQPWHVHGTLFSGTMGLTILKTIVHFYSVNLPGECMDKTVKRVFDVWCLLVSREHCYWFQSNHVMSCLIETMLSCQMSHPHGSFMFPLISWYKHKLCYWAQTSIELNDTMWIQMPLFHNMTVVITHKKCTIKRSSQ